MDVWSLASGSSGNAYLVRSERTAVLIECGLPAVRVAEHLRACGVDPRTLSAILVTHEHGDHARSVVALSAAYGVPVVASAGTLGGALLREAPLTRAIVPGRALRLGDLEVLAFRVPHDAAEPLGFRIVGQHASAALVTDVGHLPADVLRYLDGLDLLVLEANHDRERLLSGPYPAGLKRRVDGALGHLSNEAAGEAVRALRDPPQTLWLAHLSRVNNSPLQARRTVQRLLAEAGLAGLTVEVAARDRPSLRWSWASAWRQLPLF